MECEIDGMRTDSDLNDANAQPRHTQLSASLMSPNWNTDDLEMSGDLTTPEERDPYLDLRLWNLYCRYHPCHGFIKSTSCDKV